MGESAKRHEENSNMIKEIRASTDAAIRNQGASIKTLEIQIGLMSKVLQKRGFGSLTSSTEMNPRDHVKSISTTVEADTNSIRRIGSSQYAVSTSQNSTLIASHIDNSIPRKEKDLGIFTLPCYINNACFKNALANLGASDSKISKRNTKLTVELAARIVKYPKGIAKNLLVELRRDQVDDLMPTIKEGEVIEEVKARSDAKM
ncbi:hypothetical protein Tco_1455014, partial [Tanacetum coccineum]